jgi:hypothetical protein
MLRAVTGWGLVFGAAGCCALFSSSEPEREVVVPAKLEASRKAAPAGASPDPRLLDGEATFAAASAQTSADRVVDALVLCEARGGSSPGPSPVGQTKADLGLRLLAGKHPAIEAPGRLEVNVAYVSALFLTLEKGDPVELVSWDDDLFVDDLLDDVKTTYQGSFPIALEGKNVSASCRLVPPEVAAKQAERWLAEAARELADARKQVKPDAQARSFGRADEDLGRATHRLEMAAAHVGWADEAVQRGAGEVEAYRKSVDEAFAEAVKKFHDGAPAAGKQVRKGSLSARVASLSCAGERCELAIELEHGARDETVVQIDAVAADGRDVRIGEVSPVLPAGEKRTARFDVKPELVAAGLVRVTLATAGVTLLLRAR